MIAHRMPVVIAVMATAAQAVSFAFLASGWISVVVRSTAASIAVLKSSATSTRRPKPMMSARSVVDRGNTNVRLAEITLATTGAGVLLPDLRGHYGTDGPRGDVRYIGQFEDDLADLVAGYRRPGQKLVMVGHSSGGGLVIRFAGGVYGGALDGAVLMAPYLRHDAPTVVTDGAVAAGGWARPLVRRLIGLSMLNAVGVRLANGVTVMEFNLPEGALARTMTGAYSYRLNTSYAPRWDYLADVAALPDFLFLVGRDDEAFQAEAFEPAMSAVTQRGQYHVLDGVSHLDVFLNARAAGLVAGFISGLE